MDDAAATWLEGLVHPTGPVEEVHVRPWARVWRVPHHQGTAWFKACGRVQAFEPRLTHALASRHPNLLPRVLGHDDERGWLLLADAGTSAAALGNPPEAWLRLLPAYGDLQRSEASHADDHVAHGVPDLRLPALPDRYAHLVAQELPLSPEERRLLSAGAEVFGRWCAELATYAVPDSVQHGDLHMNNLFLDNGTGHDRVRVIDWGDTTIGPPFASLLETFRFLEKVNGLRPDDPWFERLRDAYLEGWPPAQRAAFPLARSVGTVAHCIAWQRQREHLPEADRAGFDVGFAEVLRRALRALTG